MIGAMRKIDHIVYAVPDLDKAVDSFEEKTGIRPVFGGHHGKQGTKNALVNLGEGGYLELLAVDEHNPNVHPPRWMGVDLLTESRITRWAIKSQNLVSDAQLLKSYRPELGITHFGQRQTSKGDLLQWGMTLPSANPLVEDVPFMTDWQTSASHPTDSLPNSCQLLVIELSHPEPQGVQRVLNSLGLDLMVRQNAAPSIKIILETPMGEVTIF